VRSDREALLARVYPRASADPNLTFSYDPGAGSFQLAAQAQAGDAPTIVYIPREVTGAVVVAGAASGSVFTGNPDGSRLVAASPTGGRFSITVGPAPLDLTRCSPPNQA
jgi:hypothetical protein